MQKLWLKNFEFQINSNTWNQAQDLAQAGAVSQLREVEKHFWVAAVRDGDQRYEVEVMITPHKIKAFTCECWESGRRLMCAHIGASLLRIRQFLEQQQTARKDPPATRKEEPAHRLSIPALLESAGPEQVVAFVREYARRDRDFALALKVWFAGKLPGLDNPFLLVLDAALPRKQAAGRSLRPPELKRLKKVLDELGQQLVQAAELADAPTVFQISTAVLEKITPVWAQLEEAKKTQIKPALQQVVDKLTGLTNNLLSPELREKRRDFLLQFLQEQPEGLFTERTIIVFLSRETADEGFFQKIRDAFDRSPTPMPKPLLHLFVAGLAQRGLPEAVVKVLSEYAAPAAPFRAALEWLYRQEHWEALLLAGMQALETGQFNSWQSRELEQWLLTAAERSGNQPQLKKLLRRTYRHSGGQETFARLKTLAGADWPNEREKLIREYEAAGETANWASLLAAESDWPALMALLRREANFQLLGLYEDRLLPENLAFVREQYVQHLSEFLEGHFGAPASQQVRAILASLLQKKQTALVREIVTALIARFPDRSGLPEELEDLFPKTRRPVFGPAG